MNQLNIINQNGQLLVDSREVAQMIGIKHSDLLEKIGGSKKVVGYIEILLNGKFRSVDFFIESTYRDTTGRTLKCYLLTKKGCDMVANKLTGEKGVLFTAEYVTRFEEMQNYIKQTSNVSPALKESFEMQLLGVQYATQILRVDETSKIRMLEEAHKRHHVPTNHLPRYVDEEVTKSLTTLLKEHEVNISTAKMNTLLIEAGILEIKERPSSKGTPKEFKSLTEKGMYFGKNLINPRSPRETQPHYFSSKFSELLELLGLKEDRVA